MADDEFSAHAFLQAYESGTSIAGSTSHSTTCCCGNDSCAYLRHNQAALEGLERDVCTAAKLGQALLVRHEAYIADSEKEREAMNVHIQTLENEKKMLEEQNATVIEENRSLLDQLESLNNAVAESDIQVTNLQATLRSAHQELHKLSSLASRTEHLEQQLAEFEREQALWQATVHEKEGAERSALRRWQQAERTLLHLQEQTERIEREAKEERERHVEVLQRMERRHAVERELGSAAGRLKGAAASKGAGQDANGPTVVSHFVKDILQDNANLQMGIVELRDMLQTSNEEVETLRSQLSVHQPVAEDSIADTTLLATRPHLSEEMRRATSQELHVHHHYHAPPATPKTASIRKPKKKRHGALTPGHYTPSSGRSTPQHYPPLTPSNTAAILSQTSASLPDSGMHDKRWSMQSMQSYQSYQSVQYSDPSSPISTNRSSSMFDRVFSDAGQDSSRPTTPDTEEPGTPLFAPTASKRSSISSYHTFRNSVSHRARPSLDSILDISTENLRQIEQQHAPEAVIPEEDELAWENASSSRDGPDSSVISPLSEELDAFERRPLRRAASHESIMSFSGMDIHTLKNRPSQLLTTHGARSFTPQAVVSGMTAHATRPAALSRSPMSGQSLLSGMAPPAQRPTGPKQGIGSKVGGWVFGRWGASPAPVVSHNTTLAAPKLNRAPSVASGSSTGKSTEDPHATPRKPKLRPPGINQTGPIMGFFPEVKIQHPPIMKSLDQDALKSVLGG
ncbi:unnamed protein product [Zymoseptoria tritici ST99CH_1A5]|uniref:Uncharacterized protein n=1 Tax=Zymoseptoria tritici ST99CH_1A5 TaxID=1276529 RepID=A0A1Y6L9N4_ZYMTR|nr:unnamed protein product [Zymoseptoria tritici ST99CH_1A5]